MFCKILRWNHLIQGFCVPGVFWLVLRLCQLLSVSSGFLLLLHSVLEDYTFIENCPFHLGFQLSCHIFFVVISYNRFYFCVSSCNISYFTSDFDYLSPLFFLMSLLKCLSILLIFSKTQFLDLLILRIVLLVSVSILHWSWLFPSFYLLWDAFVVVPPVLVHVGLGCLFEAFLSFIRGPLSLWTSLSGPPLLCPIGFGLLCVPFHLFPESF